MAALVNFPCEFSFPLTSFHLYFLRYSVIPTLADILSESAKEKVTRIVLAVFRNLIDKPEDPAIARENCIQMVQCKVRLKLYSSDD